MPSYLHGIIIIGQSIENIMIRGRVEFNSPAHKNTGRMQYAPTKYEFKSPLQLLGAIVRGYNSSVTKILRELSGDSELKIWQRNYYEHIIRNDNDLHRIRTYIRNNPLKWEIDEYYKLPQKLVRKQNRINLGV